MPASPDEYKPELPKDFKLPEGAQLLADDPAWGIMRAVAHELKVDQEGFSKLAGGLANYLVMQHENTAKFMAAEQAKLGPKGSERMSAATTFLAGLTGDEKAAGEFMHSRTATSADIEFVEKMQRALATQGGGSYRGNGREPAPVPSVPLEKKLWPNRPVA